MPEPGSASARVRSAVAAAANGPLRIVHRGPLAVYAELRGFGCLGVTAASAVSLPCAIGLARPALPAIHTMRIEGGTLRLDDLEVRIGRLTDPAVPALGWAEAAAATTDPVADAELAGFPDPSSPGAVDRLIGRGSGLTPLGDDLLCGWLATHRALGVPTPELDMAVADRSERTTLLSATLLACAAQGEAITEFSAWLRALGTPREPAAAAALASIGHSSGRGLLHGGRSALRHLLSTTRQGGNAA